MLLASCERAKPRSTIVLAAASTYSVMQELASSFEEAEEGVEVVVSTGPSNGLARQILSGVDAQIFLSANPKWMKEVQRSGVVHESTNLLGNRLVLVVPSGNPAQIQSPSDLISLPASEIAIASSNAPAGIYAEHALRSWGVLEPLTQAGKMVRGTDVRSTLTYVERGEVKAGVVYATDAMASSNVSVVHVFEKATHPVIEYSVALLESGASHGPSRRFFEFLQSVEAKSKFREFGFVDPE